MRGRAPSERFGQRREYRALIPIVASVGETRHADAKATLRLTQRGGEGGGWGLCLLDGISNAKGAVLREMAGLPLGGSPYEAVAATIARVKIWRKLNGPLAEITHRKEKQAGSSEIPRGRRPIALSG